MAFSVICLNVVIFLLAKANGAYLKGRELQEDLKGKNARFPDDIKPIAMKGGKDPNGVDPKDSKDAKKAKGKDGKVMSVKSPAGEFLGTSLGDNARIWESIPYAKPPVGNLRFANPVAADKYNRMYDTNFQAPACVQVPTAQFHPPSTSEDCLYLSVTAPNDPPAKGSSGYPIVVWIHGGAYLYGYGVGEPYSDMSAFAENGVVGVSINYRMGAFGFLSTSTLAGNFAILDQQLALKWVKTNIASFGGDPSKVTIMGESAGAASVGIHLVSPGSSGLFRSAIQQSNPLYYSYYTRAQAQAQAAVLFTALGCAVEDVACMRGKSAISIAQATSLLVLAPTNIYPFPPVIEAAGVIPVQPYLAFTSGTYINNVPILTGFNADEFRFFMASRFPVVISAAAYPAYIAAFLGAAAVSAVTTLYPFSGAVTDGRDLLGMLGTDLSFVCPILSAAAGAVGKRAPVFVYEFAHKYAGQPPSTFCTGYSCHAYEIPYVFGTVPSPTAAEKVLSDGMNRAWSNFITSGNPNTGLSLPFPSFLQLDATGQYLLLNDGSSSLHTTYSRQYVCPLFAAFLPH